MSDSKLNPTRNNQSTEKALAIIEYLASQPAPARLRDISDALSLNVSTAARFLSALQNCGYAAQEAASQRYYLTYKICRIANQVSSATHLPTITHPHLVRLSEQFRKALHVSVERSMSMVCIDSADRLLRPQFHTLQVGEATPLHCTACGKLFLLNYSEEQLALLLSKDRLVRYTENTICVKEDLIRELNLTRRRGYACNQEEYKDGICCIAYPVFDYTGKVTAAIGMTSSPEEFGTISEDAS